MCKNDYNLSSYRLYCNIILSITNKIHIPVALASIWFCFCNYLQVKIKIKKCPARVFSPSCTYSGSIFSPLVLGKKNPVVVQSAAWIIHFSDAGIWGECGWWQLESRHLQTQPNIKKKQNNSHYSCLCPGSLLSTANKSKRKFPWSGLVCEKRNLRNRPHHTSCWQPRSLWTLTVVLAC